MTPSVLRAAEGNYVHLTAAEDADTVLGTLRATWTNGTETVELEILQDSYGVAYFTMPAGDVTVTADFRHAQPLTVALGTKVRLDGIWANGKYYNETTSVKVATNTEVGVYFESGVGYEPRVSVATATGEPVESACEVEDGDGYLTFTMPDAPVVVTISAVRADLPVLVVGDNAVDAEYKLFSFTPAETAEYVFSSENGYLDVYNDQGLWMDEGSDSLSIALVGGETYFVDYNFGNFWDGTAKNLRVEKSGTTVELYRINVDPDIVGGTIEVIPTNAPYSHVIGLRPVPAPGYAYVGGSLAMGYDSYFETPTDWGDGTYYFWMPPTNITVTALFDPLPGGYPTYLAEAEDLVKSNYVAWAAQYGNDTANVHAAAFLLGIDPAAAIPAGAELLKVVNFGFTNNVLHLELASDVCDLFQPAGLSGTAALCNGVLTLKAASTLELLDDYRSLRSLPVRIDASGHAVIDLDLSGIDPPPAMFIRPQITVKLHLVE